MTGDLIEFSKLQDTDFMRSLVKRVINDSGGGMTRLEACTFVAGMIEGATGWDVHLAIDADAIRRRKQAGL